MSHNVFVSRFAAVGAVVLALVAGGVILARYRAYDALVLPDKMASGVRVAGTDVGGLTITEARERLRQWAVEKQAMPVRFVAPQSERRWNVTLAETGGRFDIDSALNAATAIGRNATFWEKVRDGGQTRSVEIPVAFLFNEAALDRHLTRIADAVYRKPVDARARITDSNQIVVAAWEQKGVSLDTAATKTALLKSGPDALRNGASVTLVIREEIPKITASDLGKIGNVLASFSTGYASSTSERSHNVELAAAKINGTLLAPGEEFSYNRIVGPREKEFGWQSALMFQDGEVVPGVGGGVCQVASTLYNAVLRTDLKLTQRQNHSIKVHYVDPGRDATVVYGALDFRFANNTGNPVLVLARTRNRRLTINLYGATPRKNEEVEIVSGPLPE